MARRPRLAAQAAAASMRTPIPNISDNEDDEEMAEAPPPDASAQGEEDEEHDQEGEEDEEQEDAEDDATPSRGSPRQSRPGTPRRPTRQSMLHTRRKRLGRPPKHRPVVASDDEANEPASDTGTPKRRGGFRGHRGGRWGKARAGQSRLTHAPLDGDGNALEIVNDEVELPDIAEGEKKVNKNGELLGGREYRVRTFTVIGRGKRLYMLSTEPARCIGFRDSYLFFQKHKHLYKIIIDDEEKRDLIERDLIPHSYKGRAIGVVTARSVFREFGAKIVIAGKKVTDDYDAQGARERGDVEGELAVPEDRLPLPGEPYNRNQYVAWHGASAVYHTNAPSLPLQNGKLPDGKRKKIVVTSDNWMFEHAREASRFNASLTESRKDICKGLYDIHTNTMQWPSVMQPTHARWEIVDESTNPHPQPSPPKHHLTPLDEVYSRNFRIHDLHCETAPDSSLGVPGRFFDPRSLASIPHFVLDELSETEKRYFDEAVAREQEWRGKWTTETLDGGRARFGSSVEWFPK